MGRLLSSIVIGGFLAMSSHALAQDGNATAEEAYGGAAQRDWMYELQLYIWGTEVGGTAAGADFTIGFDEILENLNFTLMGGLKAYQRNGPWMTYGELGYADIRQGGEASFTINPGPGPGGNVDAVADGDMQVTVVSFGGGYQIASSETHNAYATLGGRYLRLSAQFDADIGRQSFEIDGEEEYWDAVVGINGRAYFNDDWFVSYLADIGAGQSDLTWQAALGLGYTFGRSDVMFGYRHLAWDLPDDDMISEYYQSGPLIVWNYRF